MSNFNPYGGYGGYPPSYPAPAYPSQPPASIPTQLNTYAFVDGIEGAKAYQVKPGTVMLLMDSRNPICYKKEVNNYGQTILLETYDMVLHKEESNPSVDYITKDEFQKEIEQIKALIHKGE